MLEQFRWRRAARLGGTHKCADDCDICVPERCRSRRADKRPIHEGGRMKRFGFWPIVAFILLAVPLLMMAFPQPPAGNTGAPSDGTCGAGHNNVATVGSVVALFPGTNYTPGVAQHVSVTVTDSNTAHNAWSFQMTARQGASTTQVGSFTATDTTNTIVSGGDMETTATGNSLKTWSFTWTPPTTNV